MNTTEITLDAVVLMEAIDEYVGRTVHFTSHGMGFRGELVTVLDRGNGVPPDRRLTVILRGNTEATAGFRTRIAVEFRGAEEAKRQFCRKGQHTCTPAVTLTFDSGARRLHWCAEHSADAEQYRADSDQRAGWVDMVDFMHELSEPFYTPAAGDADRCNELGQPTGYVHRSAG